SVLPSLRLRKATKYRGPVAMLLHPPGNDLHLCFHVRDTPELPAGCLAVENPVQVPVNGSCLTERNERLPDCTDLLDPCPFAGGPCAKGPFPFPDTFAVTVCPLRGAHTSPAAAYAFLLVGLDRTVGNKTAQVLTGDSVLDVRDTLGIEPDAVDTAF